MDLDEDLLVEISIRKNPSGEKAWRIELRGMSRDEQRILGYRASGTVPHLSSKVGSFPIAVHDADRPVWTTMPLNDRADIRKAMEDLLYSARKALQESGYRPMGS